MFAKQTSLSASLVVLLVGSSVIAHADPDAPVEPATAEAHPPIAAATVPPTGSFEIGAGFSSDEGFLARARVAQSNLFGTGHSLSLDGSLSKRRQHFELDYTTADLGDGVQLGAQLYNDRRQLPGFVRQASGGGVTLSRQLTPHLRVFGGYRLEHVAADDGTLVLARGLPASSELQGGLISSVRVGIEYNSVDHADAPTSGTLARVTYEVADKRLGSDFSFDRIHAFVAHHRPVGPFTLHLDASLTQLGGMSVPRTERLFLDGSSDIRGFLPGALGPVDAFGRPLGGTTKLVAHAELEAPISRKLGLSVVGFLDAGGIADASGTSLGRSVGVGLLWRSPIGPLRFDWAVPLDGAGPPRFLFSLGGSW
jgi:outer membrane protein insertion porin family